MSPTQPAVVTNAEVLAAFRRLPLTGNMAFPVIRAALEAAAAVRCDAVTTRLTEAADRVAKAEERAEKAEAAVAHQGVSAQVARLTARAEKAEADLTAHVEDCDSYMAELEAKMFEQAAQVVDLTAKLEEARGVLREIAEEDWVESCLDPQRAARLAKTVLAPETGKELKE